MSGSAKWCCLIVFEKEIMADKNYYDIPSCSIFPYDDRNYGNCQIFRTIISDGDAEKL